MSRFVAGYSFPDDRREVVLQGEIGFATALECAGIRFEAMISHSDVVKSWLSEGNRRQRWLDELAMGRSTIAVRQHLPTTVASSFADRGHSWMTWLTTAVRRGEAFNPQHVFWDTLCTAFGYPFIKRDLVTVNPFNVPSVASIPDVIAPENRIRFLRSLSEITSPTSKFSQSLFRISRDTADAWLSLQD
jgi:hypothetical protein